MTVSLEFELKEAKAITALQHVIREQVKAEEGAKALGKAYKDVGDQMTAADRKFSQEFVANRAKERREWGSFLQEVRRLNTNPLEAFAQRQERLNTALRAGALDQQMYNREISRMRSELEPAAQEQRGLFGEVATAGVSAMIVWGKIREETGKFVQNLKEARQEQAQALQDVKGHTISQSELLEVSRGSTDAELDRDFRGLKSQAEALAMKYKGLSLDDAYGVVYHARNFGNQSQEDIEAIAMTIAINKNARQTAQMGAQLKNTFSRENLSTAQILEGVAAAARHGPSSMKDYAENLGPASVMAEPLGFKFAETSSVYSALTSAMGDPKIAAARLNTVMQRIRRHREDLGSPKTLMEGVKAMQRLEKEQPALFATDIEGRTESVQVYEALSNPKYAQIVAETQQDVLQSMSGAGGPGSELARRLRVRDADPLLGGAAEVDRSRTQLELTQQSLARREAANEVAINRAKRQLIRSGMIGPLRKRVESLMDTMRDWYGYEGSPVSPEGLGFAGVGYGSIMQGPRILSPAGARQFGQAGKATEGYLREIEQEPQSKELQAQTRLLEDILGELRNPRAAIGRGMAAVAIGAARAQAAQQPK